MRKLSDIVRRSPSATFDPPQRFLVVDFEITAPDHGALEIISRLYREIDYPRSMQPGNKAHISGANDERVIFTSLWSCDEQAKKSNEEVTESIKNLSSGFGDDVSVVCRSNPAVRVDVADSVSEFDAARAELNPDCVAFTIDIPQPGREIYELFCDQMRYPELPADGLLFHLAYEFDDAFRTITVWRSIEHSTQFMRDRIVPAGPMVVREHGVFPEVRPVEFKPTLLAFNAASEEDASR